MKEIELIEKYGVLTSEYVGRYKYIYTFNNPTKIGQTTVIRYSLSECLSKVLQLINIYLEEV